MNFSRSIDRRGRVEDGNTVSDFDPREEATDFTTGLCGAGFYNGYKINLVDLPGYFDFVGETIQGMRAVDIAMIVISATSGMRSGPKNLKYTEKIKLPRAFYVNKMDRENADLIKFLVFKRKIRSCRCSGQYPVGKEDNFRGVINVISGRARIHDPKTVDD